MIIGGDRLPVIENIKKRVSAGELNEKVELHDPILTLEQAREITGKYLKKRHSPMFNFKSFIANTIADIGGKIINKETEYVGSVDPEVLNRGFIVTSNHFSPLENTIVRTYFHKIGNKKMSIVSQVTNFAMGGIVGFLMNYARTIPLSMDARYMARDLTEIIGERVANGGAVLIYPEQEMWFNYRKPRPFREGAYHFASKLNCPIVSCFVEIIDENKLENMDFYKVRYRLHVLGVIYPDKNKSTRENCKHMCRTDYEMKKEAYERIYKTPLSYVFKSSDIAGWIDYSQVLEDEK